MRIAYSACLVLGLACAAACAPDREVASAPPPITPHVFVGHINGSDALVAIVESEETLVAYSCGVGDTLGTQTGWYSGIKHGEVGQNVELVNSPSGLRMRGALDAFGGSGVITLANASEVSFTVEPARGDAGLYDFEDAAHLVGFIRANDGKTAGNSLARTSGTGTAALPNTTTSTAVTTSPTPAPAPLPTTTTPPTTTQPPIPVVIDNGARIVITRPVVKADKRVVTRTGPVVVFMMHGMADNLGMAPAGSADKFEDCAGPKDTPFYGRCEWGQDFLPGLFGSSNVRAQQTALDGSDATGDQYIKAMQNVRDFPDENLGHRLVGDCVADPEVDDKFDGKFAKHFITPGTLKANAQLDVFAKLGLPPVPPPIAAFTTWRDPTRGLVFSGRRVTRQIYAALRWYEETYQLTPGVILVAQSFGGLASRFMLSNPDPAQLVNNATLNQEKVPLCKEDLAKMDYVRDRVLYMVTLATPHEGSYLAEWGPPVKDALRALLTELRQGVANSNLAKVLRGMATISSLVSINLRPTLTESIVAAMDGFLPQLDSAAALLEMQLKRMEKHNLATISPEKARRTAASPILGAQKTLIPIYATLSRSPGSDAFDGPDLIKGFNTFQGKRAKVRGWITQTMFVSDVLTRELLPHGFGDATVAPYAPFRNILDRRARLFDSSPTTAQLETKFAADIQFVLGAVSPWFLGKFGKNADAVIGSLQGDVSVSLPRVMAPIHTSQKWKIGFDGTTVEVPIPVLVCGTKRIPIDLDALARLLVQKFGNTPNVMTAIANKDLNGILAALGVLIQNTDAFANATAEWFVGKVRELGSVPAECDAKPDNVFDVFSITELANWKVVAGTGRIPVPVFIGTGEPVSDGEMDTDGAVHSASALGFTLAREPFFFEHNRLDDGGKIGSWYRLYDNAVTERHNHGQQYENEVGLWIREAFLVSQAGPVPARDSFSVWVE